MEANQIQLLASLAKTIKAEKKDRSKIVTSLQRAKILNKKEAFTEHYRNLARLTK